jgi:hypothetical protein
LIRLKNGIYLIFKNFGFVEFVKASNVFFLLMGYVIFFLGIFSSFLILLMPTVDDMFIETMLNYMLTKYQSLDENQKNEIREVFRDVFVDTNTAETINSK